MRELLRNTLEVVMAKGSVERVRVLKGKKTLLFVFDY